MSDTDWSMPASRLLVPTPRSEICGPIESTAEPMLTPGTRVTRLSREVICACAIVSPETTASTTGTLRIDSSRLRAVTMISLWSRTGRSCACGSDCDWADAAPANPSIPSAVPASSTNDVSLCMFHLPSYADRDSAAFLETHRRAMDHACQQRLLSESNFTQSDENRNFEIRTDSHKQVLVQCASRISQDDDKPALGSDHALAARCLLRTTLPS
ncbi:hypothetical protein NOVOSPHI9U_140016 [Novosphingobium sp. 9U]|nr:hypothetical protein NOVOSPHI9U_140016 [Novosphingobium sp. 9U]